MIILVDYLRILNTSVKVISHQSENESESEKIKEPAGKIREKAANIKGHFRFRQRFRLV